MGKLDFVDSFQFLSTSLEKLVHNLAKEGAEKFKLPKQYIERKFPRSIKEKLELLMRKGVYLYEYVDSKEKFNETCLPDRSAFFLAALLTKAYHNRIMIMPRLCGKCFRYQIWANITIFIWKLTLSC